MLQRLYDWLVPVDARAKETEAKRSQNAEQRLESSRAKRLEQAIKELYETSDGARAAKIVAKQRAEEERPILREQVPLESWEQAQLAQEESDREEWREAFKDFDQENLNGRISRTRQALEELLKQRKSEFDISDESPRERNWDDINAIPARGFAEPGNGREPYRQMALLKATETPVEIPLETPIEVHQESKPIPEKQPQESSDEAPKEEVHTHSKVNWEAVNDAAKTVTNSDQAKRNANLAINCGKEDLAEFWQELANELDQAEQSDQPSKEIQFDEDFDNDEELDD